MLETSAAFLVLVGIVAIVSGNAYVWAAMVGGAVVMFPVLIHIVRSEHANRKLGS